MDNAMTMPDAESSSPQWTYWVPVVANPLLQIGWIKRDDPARHGAEFEVALWWFNGMDPEFGPTTQQTLVIHTRLSAQRTSVPFSVHRPNERSSFLSGDLQWRRPSRASTGQLWLERLNYPGGRVESAWIA
jgi:hypothetical protein